MIMINTNVNGLLTGNGMMSGFLQIHWPLNRTHASPLSIIAAVLRGRTRNVSGNKIGAVHVKE